MKTRICLFETCDKHAVFNVFRSDEKESGATGFDVCEQHVSEAFADHPTPRHWLVYLVEDQVE